MAKRGRSRTSKQKLTKPSPSPAGLPKAVETIGFTDAEQDFFRTGDDSAALAVAAEHQEPSGPPRSSIWRRLFLLSA